MAEDVDLTMFPSSPKRDVASVVGQAVAGLLPYGGGVVGVLLSALMPELSRDRIAWLEYVGEAVLQHTQRLDHHDAQLDMHDETLADHEARLNELHMAELAERPEFRAAFLRTADIAMRDPLRKKWELLCNIVLHNTSPNPLDDDLQLMFMGVIETLGSQHISLLTFFNVPRRWRLTVANAPAEQMGQLTRSVEPFGVLEAELPDVMKQPGFCEQCIADLVARGLITLDANKLHYIPQPARDDPVAFNEWATQSSLARLTTSLGQQFVQFISRPFPG